MNARERGFLLLTSRLGDPERKVLTTSQLRLLADRIQKGQDPGENRELSEKDLYRLGFNREMSRRIVALLEEEERLEGYARKGMAWGCVPVTRVSPGYPLILRQRLGLDSPGCLWAMGDVEILNKPAVSLVGSRELLEPNRKFAEKVGQHAAEHGLTLVSGNARGADRTAQEACLEAGGRVVSIVADELIRHRQRQNVLFLSEDGYDEGFSSQRALSRNRCIHCLGQMVFVAQSGAHKGGTWQGTAKNLRFGWSPVVMFRDGSEAAGELEQMGAYLIGLEDLEDFGGLPEMSVSFL